MSPRGCGFSAPCSMSPIAAGALKSDGCCPSSVSARVTSGSKNLSACSNVAPETEEEEEVGGAAAFAPRPAEENTPASLPLLSPAVAGLHVLEGGRGREEDTATEAAGVCWC